MTLHGADVEQLERLALEFDRAADDLDADGGQLTRLLGDVSWLGDVATRYVGNWTGVHLPRIGLSTRFLRDAAASLRQQAEQQRSASSGVGGRIPRTPARPAVVERHLETIRAALDTGGWGVSASDLQKIRAAVAEMTPDERAAVFARLTDDELRVLKDQMQESRIKGGWSSEEQRDFLQQVLPSIAPEDARRLMGADWVEVRGTEGFDAPYDEREFVGELLSRSGDWAIRQDEIEIRDMGDGKYVIVLPGVTDLSEGGPGAPLGWDAKNQWNSARDMHYARQSEMNSVNGSVNGTNAYAFAVKQAMLAHGIPEGSQVMLVGHSFGAYTAAELATDPTFNASMGAGGYVDVTHVLGAGASAGFRMNELPDGTEGLLLNNAVDKAYLGESMLPTNNVDSDAEVVFLQGDEQHGHGVANYRSYAWNTEHPDVADFRESAHAEYGGPGNGTRITVKDPYRVPADRE